MHARPLTAAILVAALLVAPGIAQSTPEEDRAAVEALDTKYQLAVERNDAQTMGQILDERFVLVLGNGTVLTRADLLEEARTGRIKYEYQDEEPGSRTVRVWGDTAVVTAKLRLKGLRDGSVFERKLWFSDTYVRTAQGWRYVFGQASLSLPAEAKTSSR